MQGILTTPQTTIIFFFFASQSCASQIRVSYEFCASEYDDSILSRLNDSILSGWLADQYIEV
jgi:hypothetical protein